VTIIGETEACIVYIGRTACCGICCRGWHGSESRSGWG